MWPIFNQKRREFFAINFGENREQVGEAGVGDPQFLAIENVMLAVFGKLRPGAAIQSRFAPRFWALTWAKKDLYDPSLPKRIMGVAAPLPIVEN